MKKHILLILILAGMFPGFMAINGLASTENNNSVAVLTQIRYNSTGHFDVFFKVSIHF